VQDSIFPGFDPVQVLYSRQYLSEMFRALATALVAAPILVVSGVSGSAGAADSDCAGLYPEASWTQISDGAVSIEGSEIPTGIADRFRGEAALIEGWVTEEIGPVSMTVCLVGEDSAFDRDRYLVGSQQFHVVTNLDDGLFAMETTGAVGLVAPALAFGMSQQALFQNNGGPFPQPIGDVISQWYRARVLQRLPYYHRSQLGANWFESESLFDWTVGEQTIERSWDPERNGSSIGDFVDFVVANHGNEVLLETDGAAWSEIEGQWRTALRVELTGRTTPTTGWIAGAAFVIGVVVLTIFFAGMGIYRKHKKVRRDETAPPIAGFFADS
jgi:hypothetical protein